MNRIKYIRHAEIDFNKWDETIDQSYNGMVYGYSFFLNAMAGERWDALVQDDYEAVFPLVHGSKFGLKYLYQPFFCQQLGLFSKVMITDAQMAAFIEAIPSKFRYWDFHLNHRNKFFSPEIRFINRTSFVIDLRQDYISIYDRFNADAKKNLAKAALSGYLISKEPDVTTAAECFFNAYGKHYASADLLRIKITECAHRALELEKGFVRSVYDKNRKLLCSGFFLMAKNRIHYAMAAPTEEGKAVGATHILIDEVLKEFAGTDNIFDFEGSDIKTVAYFYSKFGSEKYHYLEIINNKMPWWCKGFVERRQKKS